MKREDFYIGFPQKEKNLKKKVLYFDRLEDYSVSHGTKIKP